MYIKNARTHAHSWYHLRGMANRSIARSFTLLHSAQVEMAFIAGSIAIIYAGRT